MQKLVLFGLSILASFCIFFQAEYSIAAMQSLSVDDVDPTLIGYSEKLTVKNIRIGHPITILLYDSNLNLDSEKSESYSLDLILFESKNVKITLGPKGAQNEFNPQPTVLRETGDNTGIFYSVIEIPPVINGKRISAGEQISFEYKQRGYGAFLRVQDGAISEKIASPSDDFANEKIESDLICKHTLVLVIKALDGSTACVKPETKAKLIARGWATFDSSPQSIAPLNVIVTGNQQVRIGTTHTIEVKVMRGENAVEGARVFIDIEDYGEDIIKSFDGYTNSVGYFVFSWEIPKTFDDVETLLAFIGVTDDISAKTVLFKFQVYCLPGESGCSAEGN